MLHIWGCIVTYTKCLGLSRFTSGESLQTELKYGVIELDIRDQR